MIRNLLFFLAFLSLSSAGFWDYDEVGPTKWADAHPDWKVCGHGKEQSPIDIKTKEAVSANFPFAMQYHKGDAKVINKGYTIQAKYKNAGGVDFDGQHYGFVELHFHLPAENLINGKPHNLEMHLVHKNDKDELLVVGVFFKLGMKNLALQRLLANIPSKKGGYKILKDVDIHDILPEKKHYYYFMGSLTTPPCTEGVRWVVLDQEIPISSKQLKIFKKHMNKNIRHVQPLHGRKVYQGNIED
ncbi:carbonic anhydrase [Helicobacter mustelae]|uniref:carbonic anhydrase n=1 Tax=Helicobacter mustelae (strain ATCC 43772 / CCUG 25715 / CIP 103759 / LMG 18044 / NCTC 12198 / R85-136P) TaxID=679897 RepID=D3UGG4_HELM1|nr:carbonic anhydrase family protein [Helicobacter mustelae]CBG39585.1 carbonic anhydrase [Helicobacter mustelae 12198]SQH71097.1 carbonic anhydrase [Helicobacter mustelae]